MDSARRFQLWVHEASLTCDSLASCSSLPVGGPIALTISFCLNIAITCTVMGPDEKPIVVVKAPLAKILHNPEHLTIYQDRVNIINRLVTAAYLFACYIFIHAYEEDKNDENDNDAFSTDVFMMDAFFLELLRSLQTQTRRASKDENTLWNRQLIDK